MDRDHRRVYRLSRGVRFGLFGALAAAGAAFLLYGVLTGQALAVLEKAVRICLECIGIG